MPGRDWRIQDNGELAQLGRALRDAGDNQLKKELAKAAQRATRPLKLEIRESARTTLPSSGGFNTWLADGLKVTTRLRTLGNGVGVFIVIKHRKEKADISALDRGRARHPTYGHRPWVIQIIRSGFASRVINGPFGQRAKDEFIVAVRDIARRITSPLS